MYTPNRHKQSLFTKPVRSALFSAVNLTLMIAISSIGNASSHREAPFITKHPQVDATDFYMFRSYEPGREDYVTLIANYIPVQAAYGGPNYFPLDEQALYEIHIDNDGDAREDLTFQFKIDNVQPEGGVIPIEIDGQLVTSVLRNIAPIDEQGEPGLNDIENYRLTVVEGNRRGRQGRTQVINQGTGEFTFRKPFDYSGTKTFNGEGNYENYARSLIHEFDMPGCASDISASRVFVGQRYEAFKLALGEVFDLVNFVPIDGDFFPGGVTQDPARNQLQFNNVTSFALEVHKDCLTSGNPENENIIGGWTSASLRQVNILNPRATLDKPAISGGAWVQLSRLGSPLVNELVIGYDKKDLFNGSHPRQDGQFLEFVTHPVLPAIIDSLFRAPVNATLETSFETIAPTNFPRNDLVAAFLTGIEGVNQFPGGRASEMLRLNTGDNFAPTPRELQQPLGVAAGDFAGFPNGRRPGDDVVDIALRVVMGVLCQDLPIGENGAAVNLGFCTPEDAVVGGAPLTDGAPLSAMDLNNTFPYLLTPYPGSPVDAPLPTPID